ncbi:MAG: radical SAM protein [Ruminococcus sp.]|nr:radical SAM protein [Ruminococcus sp.]
MGHSNISIFVPHAGCPHKCSFCDQHSISGAAFRPNGEYVRRVCTEALERINSPKDTEIAFFGGSFTAISRDYMTELLTAASEFVGEDMFKGIRISTRPDYISIEILDLLKQYGVTAIELGAQSLDDKVLELNDRGHSSADVVNASRLIKEQGFELGLQMMIGLYGSTEDSETATAKQICLIRPDTVRIYPVVILKNTRLGSLYQSGEYRTFEFDDVVEMTASFMEAFEKEGIRVIKVGLHASELVERDMLGGFYHPAFRELCESVIYRRLIETELENYGKVTYAEFLVPEKNLSKALGQKKSNISYFKARNIDLRIIPDRKLRDKLIIIKTR